MSGPPPASWSVDPAAAGARQVVPGLWRLRIPAAWMGHVNAYAIEREGGILLVDCGRREIRAARSRSKWPSARPGTGSRTSAGWRSPMRTPTISGLPRSFASAAERRSGRTPTTTTSTRRAGRRGGSRPARGGAGGAPGSVRRRPRGGRGGAGDGDPRQAPARRRHSRLRARCLGGTRDAGARALARLPDPARARIAIVGDLICAAFAPWLDYGWTPDPAGELLGSLDRLDAAGPLDLALPGHGRQLTGIGAITAGHRREIRARIAATDEALAERPATGYELATRVFGEAPDTAAVGHLSETLVYLRRAGEVVRTVAADGTHLYSGGGRAPVQ